MKNIILSFSYAFLLLVFTTSANFHQPVSKNQALLKGAWKMRDTPDDQIVIFTGDYFSYANYNKATKQFLVTFGGTYKTGDAQIITHLEFHSGDKEQVGKSISYPITISNETLTITVEGENTTWEKLDNGSAPLAGNWHITHRKQDGNLQAIHQTGGRKTVKLLSGSRFQWAAINTDTKEFFGTGGGTYTFREGKYTENIEFFSRDSSRVGASLSFKGEIKNDGWHHSGLSSRGDTIYEVWNKTK